MRTLALVAFLGAGCQQARAPSTTAASSGAAEVATTPTVAKIVFIDKENACHCTKKRAAGTPATLPVERIHIDTEAAKARPTRCSSRSWCPRGSTS